MPTYQINQIPPDTVVIHCSDPRFQESFRLYLDDIGINHPELIVIPGGIHDLVSPSRIKAARTLKEQIEFMVKNGNVHRIVIIGHEDCRWENHWQKLVSIFLHDYTHLLKETINLIEKKTGVDIQYHFAKIEGGKITITQVF